MYFLKTKLWNENRNVFPSVKIINFKEAESYFGNGEYDYIPLIDFFKICENTPLFDYFIMWDITHKVEYDWILLDVYSFASTPAPTVRGYLISENFKKLLEKFNLTIPHKFYPSKLMFQQEKLDYYIFQMAWDEWAEYDFQKSTYFEKINDEWIKLDIKVSNSKEFRKIYKLWDSDNEKYKMKLVLKKKYDIFYFQYIGFVISEELKTKIVEEKITGLEISSYTNIEFEFLVG
jgi:hypothetical protein